MTTWSAVTGNAGVFQPVWRVVTLKTAKKNIGSENLINSMFINF